MDFNSIIDKAKKNSSKVSKTLCSLDSEVDKEKRRKLRQIEAEKKARLEELKKKKEREVVRREPTPEKKFVIPKKKGDSADVDKERIKAFLAKKEEEKRQDEKRKLAEKEKLIEMRLKTFGGKANKKLAKHFGMDPVDLQIRYGNDHSLVEQLQKQKWREQDEQDRLTDSLRGGVYRAISEKKKVEAKVKSSGIVHKEPHRVSTSKSNSMAGLSSRHGVRDHFSPPRTTDKKKPEPVVEKKKRPAPAVDFNLLMKAAEDISQGKEIPIDKIIETKKPRMEPPRPQSSYRPPPPPVQKSAPRPAPSSSDSLRKMNKPSSSRDVPSSSGQKSDKKSDEKSDKKPDKRNGRFVKGPTPPPLIPPAQPGKKYLPGDVRNRELGNTESRKIHLERMSSDRPKPKEKAPEPRKAPREDDRRPKPAKPDISRDRERERERERMNRPTSSNSSSQKQELVRRRREEEQQRSRHQSVTRDRFDERHSAANRNRFNPPPSRRYDEYDEEDEEEYDSDMDDFIDDTEMDDINRADFEETLRMVNPKYNKKKWTERERMIDDRRMDADYKTIAKEEARSSRLGLIEDYLEAKKGKSFAL